MADQSASQDQQAGDNKPTKSESNLETTTAKDGSLPININTPASQPPPPASDSAGEKPIVVSQEEVEAQHIPNSSSPIITSSSAQNTTQSSNNLTNEIENLSGEIQALEAKIDRLTGNIKTVSDPAVDSEKPQTSSKETVNSEPVVPASSAVTPPVGSANQKTTNKPNPLDDIYSRVSNDSRSEDSSVLKTPDTDEAQEVGGGSSLALIGEVLTVFGIIAFLLMAAYPLYASLLSSEISEAIRMIGWPTTVVGLAIGLILSLFNRGKVFVKVLTLLILLIAVIFYFGVAGFERFLGPVAGILDSVLSFYR